ncbi:MAG: pyridoxal-phosphate dependent enzyme [Spirochaetia bacterium]|nr:pyridoxal-phosphate dependent enzyme [Spirochaetia bacterium]
MSYEEFAEIDREELLKAAGVLQGLVHRTPILKSSTINELAQAEVFFKAENFQKVGAFKYRGASYAVSTLTEEQLKRGVATHSSGNHAQALALAARVKGIPAHIVMPENAPPNKVAAVKGYGARVVFCGPTLKDRESMLKQILEETDAHFIHPYNDRRIIAGQSSCAREFLEDVPDLDILLVPVGGGGLLSGTLLSAAETGCEVIGVEPEQADDAYRSLYSGELVTEQTPNTVADGLRTLLSPLTFSIIEHYVTAIVRVSEYEIIEAMRFIWERMKIVIEASAAVPVAALLAGKIECSCRRIGIILSGGNVNLEELPWQLER